MLTSDWIGLEEVGKYTRLQTVWSLPGHSRQANKDHSPLCHRRPNGPGRLADKVAQPTIQSAEGCTYLKCHVQGMYDSRYVVHTYIDTSSYSIVKGWMGSE